MNPSRLAVVTSRFWPISGMSQLMTSELAIGFKQMGYQVDVLTSRWEHHWSKSFCFRGLNVTRLPQPSMGPWGNFRSHRALTRSLTHSNYDVALVVGLSELLEPAVRSLAKTKTKVVLRLDDSTDSSQLLPHSFARKTLSAVSNVDLIIATLPVIQQRLIAAGIDAEKIRVVPDGAFSIETNNKTVDQQSAARLALCDAHPILAMDPSAPLIVTGVPLNGDGGIYDLIHAWKPVSHRFPNARIWLLGDGPQGKTVWSQITKSNLVYSAIMPGFFDSLDDIFCAADVYVHPSRDEVGHSFLTQAMAGGVCPVSTDDLGGHIKDGVNGLVVSRQSPEELGEALSRLIKNRTLSTELGMAAQATTMANRSFESTLKLIHELLFEHATATTAASTCEPIN